MSIEKLKNKAEKSWVGCDGCGQDDKQMWINGYLAGALSNQIELPSDEEILKIAFEKTNSINEQVSFNNGAIYICRLIEEQNNG